MIGLAVNTFDSSTGLHGHSHGVVQLRYELVPMALSAGLVPDKLGAHRNPCGIPSVGMAPLSGIAR